MKTISRIILMSLLVIVLTSCNTFTPQPTEAPKPTETNSPTSTSNPESTNPPVKILDQIDQLIREVVANPYFGLFGFIIGLIGLIFSYYVAKRDKRIKELDCVLVNPHYGLFVAINFETQEYVYYGMAMECWDTPTPTP